MCVKNAVIRPECGLTHEKTSGHFDFIRSGDYERHRFKADLRLVDLQRGMKLNLVIQIKNLAIAHYRD